MDAVLAHADDGQVEPLTAPGGRCQRTRCSERRSDRSQALTLLALIVVVPAIRRTDGQVDGPHRTVCHQYCVVTRQMSRVQHCTLLIHCEINVHSIQPIVNVRKKTEVIYTTSC